MLSAVDAAIAVIDLDGPEAVSVRRLAKELNYSRSGLSYRIGSMPELETQVFIAIASDLGHTLVGDKPFRPDDPAWLRASAARVLDWWDAHPNRAAFLVATRLPDAACCPAVAAVLDDVLGPGHGVECASVNYLVSAFALTLEIVRLFQDRDQALDAIAAHCAATWRTLVIAARRPVPA